MKRMKKIAVFALASMMTLSMAAPAMAATHTITINNSATGNVQTAQHTMKAYQLFKGDISDGKLVEISWGTGFDAASLIAALKKDATIGAKFEAIAYDAEDADASAQDVAKVIEKLNADEVKALNAVLAKEAENSCANNGGTTTITVPEEGYYFIKDEESIDKDGSDANSDYILQVLDDVVITIKTDAPSIEKKILDDKDKDGDIDLVDTNTASIGETVMYQLKSIIPDTKDYDTYYYYYMTDTFSTGLTFDDVYDVWIDLDADGVMDANEKLTEDTDYYVYEDGQTMTVAFDGAKVLEWGKNANYVGKNVYVNYGAVLNSSAVVGVNGNPNKVVLDYSNNPTFDYDFDKTGDKDKPGLPDKESENKAPIGETPEDIVITYTTQVQLTKYADDAKEGYELEGAEFTLTGKAYKTIYKTADVFTEDENGTYYLLKDGTYTEDVPQNTVSQEMVAAKEGAKNGYVVAAETDEAKDTDVTINGVRYRVVNADETPTHVLKTTTVDDAAYASTTVKYTKTTATTTDVVEYDVKRVFTTGADGIITFTGLDAGNYELEETVVPDGYNKCDNIKFTITGTTVTEVVDGTEQCTWTEDTGKFNVDLGKFSINIINKSGAELPETGGIGTTIFYVAGLAMVMGAGVLMVTRRRMAR